MMTAILEKKNAACFQEGCLTLYDVSWQQFEAIEAAFEGICGLRFVYLDGILDIMAPLSDEHEESKSTIGLLVEAYLQHIGIRFYARGGPTLGSKALGARKEPDESYNLGSKKPVPDIAIEVVVTSGGVEVLEVYKRLGVPEVWFWQDNQMVVFCLGEGGYVGCEKSGLLPDLDLVLLSKYVNFEDQFDAVNEFRSVIRGEEVGEGMG